MLLLTFELEANLTIRDFFRELIVGVFGSTFKNPVFYSGFWNSAPDKAINLGHTILFSPIY